MRYILLINTDETADAARTAEEHETIVATTHDKAALTDEDPNR